MEKMEKSQVCGEGAAGGCFMVSREDGFLKLYRMPGIFEHDFDGILSIQICIGREAECKQMGMTASSFPEGD